MRNSVELILGTLKKFLIGSITLTFVMIIFNLMYIDAIVRTTQNFVERVQYEGYIVDDMYLNYLDQMQFNDLKVEMIHIKAQRAIDQPKTIASKYQILEKVFGSEGIYKFEEGDTFYIHVQAQLFFFKVNKELGGLVLNEKYH